MSTIFDYGKFLKYYTTLSNVTKEPNTTIEVQFYHNNTGAINKGKLGNTSITINNNKYFIRANHTKKEIMFTIPTTISGYTGLWDTHYHFGIDNKRVINKSSIFHKSNRDLIYFHKTIQEPQNNNKIHKNCYFFYQEPIDDINLIPDIKCLQTSNSKMSDFFPPESDDIKIITEIIRRPFYGKLYGGKRRRCSCKIKSKIKRCTAKKRSGHNYA
jgi:hypothetical protein